MISTAVLDAVERGSQCHRVAVARLDVVTGGGAGLQVSCSPNLSQSNDTESRRSKGVRLPKSRSFQILREDLTDAKSLKQMCRDHGISQAT